MIRWRHKTSPIITKSEKVALREHSSNAFSTTRHKSQKMHPFQKCLLLSGFSPTKTPPIIQSMSHLLLLIRYLSYRKKSKNKKRKKKKKRQLKKRRSSTKHTSSNKSQLRMKTILRSQKNRFILKNRARSSQLFEK